MTTDAYGNIRSDQFPVTAGVQYDATAWIRGEVDTDDSRNGTVWIVRVRWEDANGDYLSYSNAEVGTAANGLPSSFAEKGGTVTAPAGAVYGRAEVYFYLASGWLNVDDVSVTPTSTTNTTGTKYYGFGGDTVGMRVVGNCHGYSVTSSVPPASPTRPTGLARRGSSITRTGGSATRAVPRWLTPMSGSPANASTRRPVSCSTRPAITTR